MKLMRPLYGVDIEIVRCFFLVKYLYVEERGDAPDPWGKGGRPRPLPTMRRSSINSKHWEEQATNKEAENEALIGLKFILEMKEDKPKYLKNKMSSRPQYLPSCST